MLINLSIRNFIIVSQLDIDFTGGMTAITGETGAGKSIAIDALGLCLGDRAEAGAIRKGCDKAEITATFAITEQSRAWQWLQQHDFNIEDGTCYLRRVVNSEGRSKAYINGTPVPLQQLRALSETLVSILGQHSQQALLKPTFQRNILDSDVAIASVLKDTSQFAKSYQSISREIAELLDEQQQREDRKSLLDYQLAELDEFALQQGEFEQLEKEFKKLSHGQSLLEETQWAYHILYEQEQGNVNGMLLEAIDRLNGLLEHDKNLNPVAQMLMESQINIAEASNELRDYVDNLEIDPLKMQQIENRYNQALELARKHGVQPEYLPEHHQGLHQELRSLSDENQHIEALKSQQQETLELYRQKAEKLHSLRVKRANQLSQEVTDKIKQLNMEDATFGVNVTSESPDLVSVHGFDAVEFVLSSNKGVPAERLEKAASGGELSRIGLVLQALTNQAHDIPTVVFDEVDTGISGNTASVVGGLLRQLGEQQINTGEQTQVFCVTHLPQVAAKAHQQMLVTKFSDNDMTETHILNLDESMRVEEIARLLAGDTLTESALNNAKSLLEQ